MDTEKYLYPSEEVIKNIPNLDISDEESNILINYINLTKELQILNNWYKVFRYSHIQVWESNGKNIIEINANTISMIGFGFSLVNRIESNIKIFNNKTNNKYAYFKKKYCSHEYDNIFSYKFLYCLGLV